MKHGIVMVAHGARAADWDAPFQAVLKALRAHDTATHYALAFLELQAPSTAVAVAELVAAGCMRITLVPMLLGVGSHARHDLPELLANAKAAHPALEFELTHTLGEDEAVLQALQGFVMRQR